MTIAECAVVGKLVVADIRRRPGRLLLTILSTVAAACVVVWVVSGYDSLVQKFKELSEKYMGRYELVVLPVGGKEARTPSLPQTWIDSLRQDPAVAAVDPVFQTGATIENKANPEKGVSARRLGSPGEDAAGSNSPVRTMNAGPAPMPTLVGTDAAEPPYTLVGGKWIDPKHAERMEAAISKGLADRIGVKLGDEVLVGSGRPGEVFSLKLVGIVSQRTAVPSATFMVGLPPSRGPHRWPTVRPCWPSMCPRSWRKKWPEFPLRSTSPAWCWLRGSRSANFAPSGRNASSRRLRESSSKPRRTWGRNSIRVGRRRLSADRLSPPPASPCWPLFIIFTTLNMGVDERVRQFAMLRAVALTKTQIGAMIAAESIFLGLVGWGGGLLAGWGLLEIMSRLRPAFFPVGVSLGPWCIALSGTCALGGALAASAIPAWRATQVSPLEAMVVRPLVRPLAVFLGTHGRRPGVDLCPAVGGVLAAHAGQIAVCGFGARGVPHHGNRVHHAHAADRRVHGQVLRAAHRAVLGVNSRLLATQLTSNLWRAVGTAAALTIGLGLFVATQTWGYSMLAPFMPGDWARRAGWHHPRGRARVGDRCGPPRERDQRRSVPAGGRAAGEICRGSHRRRARVRHPSGQLRYDRRRSRSGARGRPADVQLPICRGNRAARQWRNSAAAATVWCPTTSSVKVAWAWATNSR